MSPDTSIRGSVRHVALVVLFAVVVTVAGIAPAVAGAPSPASTYQISEMDAPASLTNGESYTISAQLSNPGQTDMQVVAFRIDTNGDGEFTPNESLGAKAFVILGGDSRTITFDVTVPEDLAPGEYEYMLWTESSSTTGTIDVESPIAPATFLLAGASAPESVAAGDSFVVSTDVANVGDLNGSETLSLYLDTDGDGNLTDEAALTNTTFELASASNGSVDLSAVAPDVAPGEYAFAVGSSTEMVSGTVEVTEPHALFGIVSFRDSRAPVGGSLPVTTIIENLGDEERSGVIELRLDANGDGEFSASETVRTREVTLGSGSSETHNFNVPLSSAFTPGEYEMAIVSPTHQKTATFEVYRPTAAPKEDDGPDSLTREDIAQALYGESYDDLNVDQAWQVEDVYDRHDTADGFDLDSFETLEEIADRKYGGTFKIDSRHLDDESLIDLTRAELLDVQNTYDSQFGPLPTSPEYTLEELSQSIYFESFDDLSGYEAVRVQMIYNRQPLAVDDSSVDTLRGILNKNLSAGELQGQDGYIWLWQNYSSEPGLTSEDVLGAQDEYEDQFEESR